MCDVQWAVSKYHDIIYNIMCFLCSMEHQEQKYQGTKYYLSSYQALYVCITFLPQTVQAVYKWMVINHKLMVTFYQIHFDITKHKPSTMYDIKMTALYQNGCPYNCPFNHVQGTTRKGRLFLFAFNNSKHTAELVMNDSSFKDNQWKGSSEVPTQLPTQGPKSSNP